MNFKCLAVAVVISTGLLGSSSVAAMQDATPEASPVATPGLPAGCSVIADGLVNPRYVAVGRRSNHLCV